MARRSSRSRSRRRGGETGKHVVGIGIIAVCLVAAVVVGIAMTRIEPRPTLDKTSLCPTDGPRSATVILLDASDVLPDVTRRELMTYLFDAATAVSEHGLLEIRLLDPNSPSGMSVFSKCNPGDGSGLDEFTGNPRLAKKRWDEGFRKPLEAALNGSMAQPSESQSSPILSTIQSISVDRFTGSRAASMPKTLIVVSDLIEHGPGYSQYSGDLSFDRYRKSEHYKRVRTDLNGAEVSFRYIQRVTRRPINSATHIQFWTDWVKDSNGQLVSARKLQGAG
ncbi:hypothetical protein BB934_45655 (plasmid) [Microvirga ossetica]|uniref:VWFA domain-containing protein n=1 Tax=Microvirga ossetica TaxID=1882682 RepID=A0A1B2F001_9HYPH|nr:hypothetical protein [Microvirga ossetica]ANY85508.1 hypothetical protein BB934_45655 [Microvirga ossetica]